MPGKRSAAHGQRSSKALRHYLNLRQVPLQQPAGRQHLEHLLRALLHQPFGELLPDALRDEIVGLAAFHHLPHQLHGRLRDRKTEARSEARDAEDTDGIFGEGLAYMTQGALVEITLSVKRID